ncbi:hypothetical protein MW887_008965 [Aspergillus wentii]|nr:hypothetical protein MW887_008965 [Aspergillus wentii]
MDYSVQRLLNDKLYDRRKQGALELEKIVRDAALKDEYEKIRNIVDQLCHDYAYAVHQPHARNGGLIGLAAASIALGSVTQPGYEGVAPYLKEIVPPVLACFSDQDARVRYYACESMYNIAKIAKAEILPFFNETFDALSKLASDSEGSVKNGAELVNRLVKDIVAESAASYVSTLQISEKEASDPDGFEDAELPTAFSLAKFIPLLKERINVISAFTRTFLVSWLTLLDTIPDLELVSYLPEFLGGLIKFLGDSEKEVNVATQVLLDRFLSEIKRIARLRKGIEDSRKGQESNNRQSVTSDSVSTTIDPPIALEAEKNDNENAIEDSDSESVVVEDGLHVDGDWIPGQDVHIDYPKILEILVAFVQTSYDEEIQLTALRWIDSFFEISPEDILPFVPPLLTRVLPAMSSTSDQVRQAANRVNTSLLEYIVSLPETEERQTTTSKLPPATPSKESFERRSSTPNTKPPDASGSDPQKQSSQELSNDQTPRSSIISTPIPSVGLDYSAAVESLTLHFLNDNEVTRVAAFSWLIMLHRKAPRKILTFNDGSFGALLKTLSDPAEAVVTKDLQLISQISRSSEDKHFFGFMVDLLRLFSTDRHLLEVRGNLIIRQLCMNLSPERIYRNLAECLEKEEASTVSDLEDKLLIPSQDIEFASIMVQNLNNNLITAPELSELRKRLRNLDSREGQMFFVTLFRSWCHNAVSTFSLCLLAQAYEQAYNLLQVFAELEMTVNMLIQIDKLVQLLESPVFTYLRLQLLEPERYPYLYKCLYGVLMLLPQSSAFAALKNRLNSVSNIGLLQTGPRPAGPSASYERSTGRLKTRDENSIRWVELLDKFKFVQERARRAQTTSQRQLQQGSTSTSTSLHNPSLSAALSAAATADQARGKERTYPDTPRGSPGPSGSGGRHTPETGNQKGGSILGGAQRHKSSLSNLGRLGIGSRKSKR